MIWESYLLRQLSIYPDFFLARYFTFAFVFVSWGFKVDPECILIKFRTDDCSMDSNCNFMWLMHNNYVSMPVALLTLPAVSPTGFSVRSLWALADFSDCSSRSMVRVSFLPHSNLCSSSVMTSLPHGCIFFKFVAGRCVSITSQAFRLSVQLSSYKHFA